MNFPIADVKRISNTQVELYANCPLSWWFRYVLKIKPKASIYLLLGSVIHQALNDFYMDKILKVSVMESEEFITYTKIKLGATLTETPYALPKTGKSVEEIVDSRLAGLSSYMDIIGGKLNPIKSELSITKTIPNSNIEFIGILDLVTAEHVIDFKVCGKPWGPKKARDAMQPCAYSFLLGRPMDFQYHFISADAPPKILDRHITKDESDSYIQRAGMLGLAMTEVAQGRQKPTKCKNSCGPYTCDYCDACQLYTYGLHEELMELSTIKPEEKVAIDEFDATEELV